MPMEEDKAPPYIVRAATTSSFFILNKKEEVVKLVKSVIIKCEPMNGNKILLHVGNMQNII
jgi:hypothetical protein